MLQSRWVPRQNRIAIDAFAAAGLRVLDAYTPSLQRLDDRAATETTAAKVRDDCLHHRQPYHETSMMQWARTLEVLLATKQCAGHGDGLPTLVDSS